MSRYVRMAVVAMFVALLLGALLTSVASAWGPYGWWHCNYGYYNWCYYPYYNYCYYPTTYCYYSCYTYWPAYNWWHWPRYNWCYWPYN